jgi:RNA polymerase sigma-70 factor (ECF subfamily)
MSCALSIELPANCRLVNETAFDQNLAAPTPQAAKTIVARAQAGDLNAFGQLVVETQGVAYHMAYRMLQSEAAAADAVQDSFIKALRALATYRGGSFKSWFLRILLNTCYDMLRVQKRQATTSFDELPVETDDARQLTDPLEQPEEYAERMELRHWIERGIATLPVDQRLTLVLSDVEGYAYHEVSEFTGVPIGTVKSRLSRGRIRLRDFLLCHKVLSMPKASSSS